MTPEEEEIEHLKSEIEWRDKRINRLFELMTPIAEMADDLERQLKELRGETKAKAAQA